MISPNVELEINYRLLSLERYVFLKRFHPVFPSILEPWFSKNSFALRVLRYDLSIDSYVFFVQVVNSCSICHADLLIIYRCNWFFKFSWTSRRLLSCWVHSRWPKREMLAQFRLGNGHFPPAVFFFRVGFRVLFLVQSFRIFLGRWSWFGILDSCMSIAILIQRCRQWLENRPGPPFQIPGIWNYTERPWAH